MRVGIVFNPASYRARLFEKKKTHILKELSRHFGEVKIFDTSKEGEALKITKALVKEGYEIIIAAGGDGTINEVVNGAVGSKVKLGIIPIGISNVFARSLKIPLNIEKALETIKLMKPKKIDLGKANGRYFTLMLGAGLDALAVHRANLRLKRWLGKWVYLIAGVTAYKDLARSEIVVYENGKEVARGFHIIVANSPYYGGSHKIVPDASLEDGLLDVCVFTRSGTYHDLRYVVGVVISRHYTFPDVYIFKTKKIRLEGNDVLYHLDSEPIGKLPIEVEVVPKCIDFLIS